MVSESAYKCTIWENERIECHGELNTMFWIIELYERPMRAHTDYEKPQAETIDP